MQNSRLQNCPLTVCLVLEEWEIFLCIVSFLNFAEFLYEKTQTAMCLSTFFRSCCEEPLENPFADREEILYAK